MTCQRASFPLFLLFSLLFSSLLSLSSSSSSSSTFLPLSFQWPSANFTLRCDQLWLCIHTCTDASVVLVVPQRISARRSHFPTSLYCFSKWNLTPTGCCSSPLLLSVVPPRTFVELWKIHVSHVVTWERVRERKDERERERERAFQNMLKMNCLDIYINQ